MMTAPGRGAWTLLSRLTILSLLGPFGPLGAARAEAPEPGGLHRIPALEPEPGGLHRIPALEPEPAPPAAPPPAPPRKAPVVSLGVTGYAEASYSYNFNVPSNGITNYRGFDSRHNTFTLSNAVVDARATLGPLSGRVAVQAGHTAEASYLSEPGLGGSGSVNASSGAVWKFFQQANVGWLAPLGRGLLIEAGLFLSPIGPESIAVKDNWTWSRSNLFFLLPFYHFGVRASYPVIEGLSLTLGAYNGWNSVVDSNPEKSVSVQLTYGRPERLALSVLYMFGVERPEGAPEGRAWRHLFDAHLYFSLGRLSLLLHGNGGFEPNVFGTSYWLAGAVSAQLRLLGWLSLSGRADVFQERPAEGGAGTAAAIFLPTSAVASVTGTLEVHPLDQLSLRLESRADWAAGDLFFQGAVTGDGSALRPYVPNASSQATLTVGAVVWF